ncbi:peptidoglycan DD-metalloendopeptidase family protein [Neobacillus pocheonensis]|uniref:Peptidoglycan DD-metalloendopeptidase family protein n=1 Tax=Neobacillus pocheonensis TaxID=363869 RepID=A0ABT0W6X5_9BACI|nr:peptidoglycan DD-metalloendopeptidase family protein [Neobacillus pocheonensis]
MRDYIKRLFIAIIMALCISLLFLGTKHSEASMLDENGLKVGWIWPADGVISDTFGTRFGKHKGIDIAGKLDSPILAVADGVVVKSYYSNTYGNVVFVKLLNNFVTVYAHLNKRLVIEGQGIKQGEIIGKMGRTGQATGVHLHFETHQLEWTFDKKYAFDPEKLLGKAEVGVSVQKGVASAGNNVLEASSHVHPIAEQSPVNKSSEKKLANARKEYIVQVGDTLTSIAKKSNLTVEKIKEINRLTSEEIIPKQILIVN